MFGSNKILIEGINKYWLLKLDLEIENWKLNNGLNVINMV